MARRRYVTACAASPARAQCSPISTRARTYFGLIPMARRRCRPAASVSPSRGDAPAAEECRSAELSCADSAVRSTDISTPKSSASASLTGSDRKASMKSGSRVA